MGRPAKYPSEFRREAIALVKSSCRPVAEVARSLSIAEGTLWNWVKIDREPWRPSGQRSRTKSATSGGPSANAPDPRCAPSCSTTSRPSTTAPATKPASPTAHPPRSTPQLWQAELPKPRAHQTGATPAKGDVLAFSAFPSDHWRKIWSNNPLERLNKVNRPGFCIRSSQSLEGS